MTDLSALPKADQQAITDTLLTFLQGFKDRNADLMVNVYSGDAEWMNVFGTVKRGAGEIIEYFRELFQDEKFKRRELAGPPDTTMRVVTPEVVVVSAHVIFRDPGLDGGRRFDEDNYAQQVLQRQGDGSWRIVSEMVKDVGTDIASAAGRAGSGSA